MAKKSKAQAPAQKPESGELPPELRLPWEAGSTMRESDPLQEARRRRLDPEAVMNEAWDHPEQEHEGGAVSEDRIDRSSLSAIDAMEAEVEARTAADRDSFDDSLRRVPRRDDGTINPDGYAGPEDIPEDLPEEASEADYQDESEEAGPIPVDDGFEQHEPAGEEALAALRGKLVPVKIHGETRMVPFEEMQSGYSRMSDYTQKTQAVAEQRAELEAQDRAAMSAARAFMDRAESLQPVLDQLSPETVQRIQSQYAETQRAVEAHQQRLAREFMESEKAKLVEALPSWRDPKVAAAEQKAIADFARSTYGFTDAELAHADSRAVLMLRDAMTLHSAGETVASLRGKAGESGTPTLRPGGKRNGLNPKSARQHSRERQYAAARAEQRATGSIRSTVAALDAMLPDDLDGEW